MKQLINIYKALADKNRVRIIKLLEIRPCCVCELAEIIGISQPSISNHLKIMRNVGLIMDKKEANWVIYRLSTNLNKYTKSLLNQLNKWLNDDEQIINDINVLKTSNKCAINLENRK